MKNLNFFMRGVSVFGFCFLLMSPVVTVQAQEKRFRASTDSHAAWSIELSLKNPLTGIYRVSKEIRKVPEKRVEITLWSDQRREVSWFYKQYFMEESRHHKPGSIQIYRIDSTQKERLDFPELAWAADMTLSQTQSYEGRKAWVLRSLDDAQKGPSKLTLWVSVETGLPLALDDGYQIWRYTFQTAPKDLILPQAYQEKATRLEDLEEKNRVRSAQRPG